MDTEQAKERLAAAEKAQKAILRLAGNQDFAAVMEMILDDLVSFREQNDFLSGDILKWSQGKAQYAAELLKRFDCAATTLARIHAKQSKINRVLQQRQNNLGRT